MNDNYDGYHGAPSADDMATELHSEQGVWAISTGASQIKKAH